MDEPAHVDATRRAYDTVAVDYERLLRGALADAPVDRAVLALFAELVRSGGAGPVADLGCGPGRLTGHLVALGLDVVGIDLSPGMVAVARREHPGIPFRVGSLRALDLADGELAGVVAWYSVIHTPVTELPTVLGELARVLRPGGEAVLAFQVGDETKHHEHAYGHDVRFDAHRLDPHVVEESLRTVGLVVHTQVVRGAEGHETTPQAYLLARRT